jgi:signal transduction histidine kinase
MRSIRERVFVLVLLPLLSLIGLYAFITAVTVGDAVTLARATAIRNAIEDPIGLFEAQVQAERMLATTYLSVPTSANLAALHTQEATTDKYLSQMRGSVRSASNTSDASPPVKAGLAELLKDVASLAPLRQAISARGISRSQAQNGYSAIVSAGYNTIIRSVLQMPSATLQTQALAVMRVAQGAELILREQALFAGDVMARALPAADHAEFAQLVGEHQGLVSEGLAAVEPAIRQTIDRYVSPQAETRLTGLENAVINTRAGTVPRVSLAAYLQYSNVVAGGLDFGSYESGPILSNIGVQVSRPVDLQLTLAGGLGLWAILVSIVASVWIGRRLIRELGGLRTAARDLAEVRLPDVVQRLSAGENVALDGEVPFPNPSKDEIGQVRQAFNSVQQTAIEAAVGQARLREGISVLFRNLARRSQSLLHRQLSMLDDLELRASQPEELEPLFQLDHLTTRMRRHAEGLVVLAGDRPGRVWSKPVPLADVLRAAVAEVEDYRRVRVITRSRAALAGRAVADVIHLLAELVENATVFSPPNAPVRVIGDLVGKGFAVEIEDRGLGIDADVMTQLNAHLADPPAVDLAATELGLFVAARLARQHRIRITLRDSPFGGTTAIVVIPTDLVVSEESYSADPEAGLANQLAIQVTGRHAARSGPWDAPDAQAHTGEIWPVEGSPVALAGLTDSPPAAPPGPVEQRNGAANGRHTSPAELTDFGLPRRTRQASLAPELRDPQPTDAGAEIGEADGRSPDETRNAFNAFQRGWERGRADSAARPSADADPSGVSRQPDAVDDGSAPSAGGPEQEGMA